MKITWYGHSAFRVESGAAKILIDPFLSGNPSWGKGWEGPAEGVTHVLLTHGHNDHTLDAAAILKKTGAMLVANFEICMFLVGQGVDQGKINPGNHRRHRRLRRLHHDVRAGAAFLVLQRRGRRQYLSRQSGRAGAAFPGRQDALPHGRHRHLLRHGADQRIARAGDRHRADRRPLHHGRRGRGAGLPPLLQVRDGAALPLRDVSDDRPERRQVRRRRWRARQPRS